MDERLAAVAHSRGGVFTSAMAAEVDVDDGALARWRRTQEVVRVRRDAYVLGEPWSEASPEQRLMLRTRAVLAARPDDIASHQSALALHGLPLHGLDLVTVDVLSAVSRVRLASGLRTHARSPDQHHVVADGYRCVDIATAIAQVLVRSGLVAAMVPLDSALHRGRCSLEEVSIALDARCTSIRLRARGDQLVKRADPACESVGETRTRLMLTDHGLRVRSQVEVCDEAGVFVGKVDLLVGERVIVEFDGAVKYDGIEGRAALVAEKRREDALRALGYVVVRVTWADLASPARVIAQIRRAMAGLPTHDGRVSAS